MDTDIAIDTQDRDCSKEELRQLISHLFATLEGGRRRVSRELHDEISQRLSLLQMALQGIAAGDCQKEAWERLQFASEQVQILNSDIRSLSDRLYPAILSDLGLPAALKKLVAEFGRRGCAAAMYDSQDLPAEWAPETALSLYRITQEALETLAEHAEDTQVMVRLERSEHALRLTITDFGMGFAENGSSRTAGPGLLCMQERAQIAGGTLQVQSAPGEGTSIVVEIPLEKNVKAIAAGR